jgi:rare lipoprotein A
LKAAAARILALSLLAGLSACAMFARRPAPSPTYVVGAPYQAAGVWRYPRETFDYDETGLADTAANHSGLTANGEAFDQTALAAGHRSLQLPAIARITNLENGRQVEVRINDRGPANPARLVELTRRTAQLLSVADERAVRVRVQLLEPESRQLAMEMQGRAAPGTVPAPISVTAAPRGGVQSETLAAPLGATTRDPRRITSLPTAPTSTPAAATASVPLRMPETVTQGTPRPGTLAVDCGGFGRPEYAEIMRARLAGLGAVTTTSYDAPRDRAYQVRIRGLANVPQAEAMLARALAQGVTDARIIVE